MCSTTIEDASKGWCVNNGRQTKGSINRIFRLASLLQVTKSASGCIVKKSIGTGDQVCKWGRNKMCDRDKGDDIDGDGGGDKCLG